MTEIQKRAEGALAISDQISYSDWFLSSEEAHAIDQSELYASCSITSLHLARKIAEMLFKENNSIENGEIDKVLNHINKQGFALQFGGEELIDRIEHLKRSLLFLKESEEAKESIKRTAKPYANRRAEAIIRDTLQLPKEYEITDIDAKKAVVTALLTKVRQSLGSCFGTAPAILIQEEDPIRFLQDIEALLTIGMLRKTVQGVEYTAPMSASWGEGELNKKIAFDFSPEKKESIKLSPLFLEVLKEMQIDLQEKQIIEACISTHFSEQESKKGSFLLSYSQIIESLFQSIDVKDLSKKELFEDAKRRLKMKGECALLKAWEFTIASYAEVQFDLCRWNFYASLGVNWDDEGGIGQILYSNAKETVERTNEEIEKIREKFDAMNSEIAFLEQRAQRASSEKDIAWMTMEYRSRKTEQHHLQELVNMMSAKANKIASLHQFLLDKYDLLLKEYFQEIYDPDLHDIDVGPYDDSPAGFRLIYKHGRRNPSLWNPISSLEEYIDALCSFFSLTEQELAFDPYIEDIQEEFRSIVTRVITHIRSPLFQESALQRTQIAHGLSPVKNILENLHRLEKKPWVFTSGGSMDSLVSSYFKLEKALEVSSRWVENETELFAFFIDTTRMSYNREKKGAFFPKKEEKRIGSLLAHSPTHAFRILPFQPLFYEAWTSDTYSYSWIYNNVRDPVNQIYKEILLSPQHIEKAVHDVANLFPIELQGIAKEALLLEITPFCRIFDFAQQVQDVCRKEIRLQKCGMELLHSGLFESLIYSHFPYQTYKSAFSIIEEGIFAITKKSNISFAALRQKMAAPIFSAAEVKSLFIFALSQVFESKGKLSEEVLREALTFLRSKRALFPEPVIVADSNWVKDYFAFLVSPITCQIEFWAVTFLGTEGRPIPHWKRWLNGSDRSKTWGIYIDRSQYTT